MRINVTRYCSRLMLSHFYLSIMKCSHNGFFFFWQSYIAIVGKPLAPLHPKQVCTSQGVLIDSVICMACWWQDCEQTQPTYIVWTGTFCWKRKRIQGIIMYHCKWLTCTRGHEWFTETVYNSINTYSFQYINIYIIWQILLSKAIFFRVSQM